MTARRQVPYRTLWTAGAAAAVLAVGGLLAWHIIVRTDIEQREVLLHRARPVAQAIDLSYIQLLTGTDADLHYPVYHRLKQQLGAVRTANPQCRFVYLIGRKVDGAVFFFVDSEPIGSKNCSPPGQVYDEVTAGCRNIFDSGHELVEGPVSDRWGKRVSALVPISSPQDASVIAVLGMDVDANNWKWSMSGEIFLPLFSTALMIGLMIVVAILQSRQRRWQQAETAMTVAVGLTITMIIAWLVHTNEQRSQRDTFAHLAASQALHIADIFQDLSQTELEGLAQFIEVKRSISNAEFQQFANFLIMHPSVQAWEWVPAVHKEDRPAYEQEVRQSGLSEIGIWQQNEAGARVPAIGRDTTYPVLYVAPAAGNEHAVCFDLGSEAVRRAALEEAERTGLVTSTDPITLVQEAAHQKGMLIFRPLFAKNEPRHLRGFALAVLRIGTLMKQATANNAESPQVIMDLFLLQTGKRNELIASTRKPDGAMQSPPYSFSYPILVFGKTFTIVTTPSPAFEKLYPMNMGSITILIGLAITLTITLMIGMIVNRRKDLEQMVAERTYSLQESEKRFDQLAEQSASIVWEVDSCGLYTHINHVSEAILGYPPGEIAGRMHFSDLHPAFGREEFKKTALLIFECKEAFQNLETLMATKDGRILWVSINGIPQLNTDGGLSGYRGLITDITARQRAQKEATRHLGLINSLLDSIPDLIFYKDINGVYLGCNPQFAEFVGKSRNEIVGKTDYDLFTTEIADSFRKNDRRMLKLREPHHNEEWITYPDGRKVLIGTLKTPYLGPDGKLIGVLGISRDITELKQATETARQNAAQAEAANAAKSQFVAHMSHEIRTPINAVIGITHLLRDTPLNAEQREFIETIHYSGDVLLSTINNILDFSKIEAGKTSLETEDFDLFGVIDGVINLLGDAVTLKKIELLWSFEPDVPRWLRGDARQLRHILLNLLNNAAKFTEKGEVVLQISLELHEASVYRIHFEVVDSGIGIATESQQRLFEAFSQVNDSDVRHYGGTGLGLVICKRLVDLMGGTIGVRSMKGEGSTFWFTVPFVIASTIVPDKDAAWNHFEQARILVVDALPVNRNIHARQLRSWNMVPDMVDTADHAIDLLRQRHAESCPFQVVLIDQSPETLSLISRIRAITELAALPLIIMSPLGQHDIYTESSRSGVVLHLTRPLTPSSLINALMRVLGQAVPVVEQLEHEKAATRPTAHILLVEDNPVNQAVAVKQLRKLGYMADLAGNGREALDALDRSSYDLILMDCQMPDMDGYQVCGEIRRREGKRRHTPILAMTANALDGDREKCIAAGMDDYIAKPVRLEELGAKLAKWIGAASLVADT